MVGSMVKCLNAGAGEGLTLTSLGLLSKQRPWPVRNASM